MRKPSGPHITLSPGERRQLVTGLTFASPWLIGFIAFIAYPAGASLYYSLTEFNLFKAPVWVGLSNYEQLLFHDSLFRQALGNTVYLTVIGVPAQLVFAFLTALLLNLPIRGQPALRTIFFLPSVMPAVAMALLWMWLLNPQLGPVNYFIDEVLGWRSPNWLGDAAWAKPSIILLTLWGIGSTTVIYLAGLQNIPRNLYEAAEIDGASGWSQFWNVTVPMVSPVTLFNLITGIIWSFQYFSLPYVISGGATGDPQGSLLFYSTYLYANAFSYLKMGYASAMAWILFLITMVVSISLLRGSRRWTHYD